MDIGKLIQSIKKKYPTVEEVVVPQYQDEIDTAMGGVTSQHKKMWPHYLIRCIDSRYAASLLNNGEIRMHTLEYYRSLEYNGDGRSDKVEGVSRVFQAGAILMGDETGERTVEIFKHTTIYQHSPTGNKGFIYCLYGCYDNIFDGKPHEIVVPDDMNKLGSTKILIKNPREFFTRCKNAIKQGKFEYQRGARQIEHINLDLECSSVDYLDRTSQNWEWGPYSKPKEYEYQSEFRLYCPSPDCLKDDILTLKIKPITDIAIIIDKPMILLPAANGALDIIYGRLNKKPKSTLND